MQSAPRSFAALALLFALSHSPAFPADAAPSATAESAADARALIREKARLGVARNGREVVISWELPEVDVRALDVIRNTQKETKGRDRVANVSKKTTHYVDAVPDATVTYWYWLKITLRDGRTVGVGPIATPTAEVWSPAN